MAYVNDLLFYISKPKESIPALMLEVQKYLTNFKIHFEKSLKNSLPFIWKKESLYYLEVHISANARLLYGHNYGSLLIEITRPFSEMVWKG